MSLVNICMIAKDRPRLTQQTISSLKQNTPEGSYNLTIVDDGSRVPIVSYLGDGNVFCVRLNRSKGIVGFARNFAIRAAEQYWGRGDFLVTLDNDLFCLPGWLEQMVQVFLRHPYRRL